MNRRRRHAFATYTAITLMALVATAVLAMTTHLRTQALRTRTESNNAQLRQLLLAGASIASDLPNKVWSTNPVPAQTITVPLPADLAAAQLTLNITPQDNGADVHIGASLEDHHASQILHYIRTSQGYSLSSATLD